MRAVIILKKLHGQTKRSKKEKMNNIIVKVDECWIAGACNVFCV